LLVYPSASIAQHSYQMFDSEIEATYVGEILDVEWTNPHVWMFVDVTDAEGRPSGRYGFECRGGTAGYQREGWSTADFAPGTDVVIVANPLRNGQPGAGPVRLTFPDGSVFGTGEGPRSAGPAPD
jgi:hypothetical protein